MYYRFDGKEPVIGEGTYVSETAIVIGDVTIGKNGYIGHGVILRGDYGAIVAGDGAVIEEGVVIHAPPGKTCRIGKGVVLGHGAIVHAALIGDYAGIGMGSILSVHSSVGYESVIAEGAVVKRGQAIPEGIIVAGNPARKIRQVEDKDRELWAYTRKIYGEVAQKYLALGMERIDI